RARIPERSMDVRGARRTTVRECEVVLSRARLRPGRRKAMEGRPTPAPRVGGTLCKLDLCAPIRFSDSSGEECERPAKLDLRLGEVVRQCALETAEIVCEVGQEPVPVVVCERSSSESTVVDAAAKDRAPEDDGAILEKRLQM